MPLVKSLAKFALHRVGLLGGVRLWNRSGARILMYHRFGDASGLTRQCEHLRRFYHPLTLTELAHALKGETPLPPNAVVVTVDDGFADFREAWPIFRRYEIRPIVYLVTGFLDGELWVWTHLVAHLFAQAQRAPAEGTAFAERLKRAPNAQRLAELAELPRRLGLEAPARAGGADAPLTWDEVRRLAAEGVEFGAHTRTHPILSRVERDEQLRQEIVSSKSRIEQELSRPVLHFCYPNGLADDVGERTLFAVREAGFVTAVVTEPGLNRPGADLLQLRRFGVDPGVPELYFAELVAGARPRGHLPAR